MYHENEAAQILCDVCINEHMEPTPVKEGKIELKASCDGLFTIDVERLNEINDIDQIMIASRHTNTPVKKGEKLLGTRVIPLVIKKDKMELVKEKAGDIPLCTLHPYVLKRAGIITTGNEVFCGGIKDNFTPVVVEKIEKYHIEVTDQIIVGDDWEDIKNAILELKEKGCEIIITTGGMSVDPDDKTPGAIKQTGAKVISYGAPVLPGAMFCLAYFEDGTPVMGLPGCVMYAKSTIFDLMLPRIAAKVPVTRKDLTILGHGGLCLGCAECRYPACSFGKA